jgi:hypothetical protein
MRSHKGEKAPGNYMEGFAHKNKDQNTRNQFLMDEE